MQYKVIEKKGVRYVDNAGNRHFVAYQRPIESIGARNDCIDGLIIQGKIEAVKKETKKKEGK